MLFAELVLSVTASQPDPADDVRLPAGMSSKSANDFAGYFMSSQARQSRPLWIVPNEDGGGRISNDGATGVSNPYRIRFGESGSGSRVEAFIAKHNPADERTLVTAVRSCW